MKSTLLVLVCVALFGCGSRTERSSMATITDVFYEATSMGCIGTDWHTAVRLDNQGAAVLCGKLGKTGDAISGCWYVDSTDPVGPTLSGWTTSCQDVPIASKADAAMRSTKE